MSYTVIHATHEAVRKAGGIGTVLEGLMTSSVYQKAVRRSFLSLARFRAWRMKIFLRKVVR